MDIKPQKITLDINSDTCLQLLVVKQWDKGSRYIEITLTADGTKLELSKISSSVIFSASLNGVLVQNDTFTADNNTNTVTVKLSDNALSASGRLECEITAIKDNDKVTSATFYVKVAESAKGKSGAILDLLEGIVDSRMLQDGSVTSSKIANGAVGSSQLADGAIDRIELFNQFFLETYLSMPMRSYSVMGTIQDDTYNSLTETGVYNVGSSAGEREMLVVYKLSNAHLVQVRYLTDKIFFRGIHANKEDEFPADEWGEWEELTNKMPAADTLKLISSLGKNADPEFIAYQTSDPTTSNTIRIPLSLIKNVLGTTDTQDFVNAGDFESIDKLIGYDYQYDKIYKIEIIADLSEELPKGVYFGRYCVNGPEVLELTSFIPDGYVRTVLLDNGKCLISDVNASGADGFSPDAKVTETDEGATITITDKNGTTTANILNGKDGTSGVYVGSGEMPEDCNVQIDPDGEVIEMSAYATIEYVDTKLDGLEDFLASI